MSFLHLVFQRLKVLGEDKHFLLFLFWSLPLPLCGLKSLLEPFSGW